MNCNFRLKVITQVFYRYRYMRADFQAGCYIPGVARKVQSLRFCMEKSVHHVGNYATAPPTGRIRCETDKPQFSVQSNQKPLIFVARAPIQVRLNF
jgi:hypothetical protein